MDAKLQLTAQRRPGRSSMARLNPALMAALHVSGAGCEICRDMEREIDALPEGGEFTEAASFPGNTIQKLDAHFRTHWKDDYRFLDLGAIKAAP